MSTKLHLYILCHALSTGLNPTIQWTPSHHPMDPNKKINKVGSLGVSSVELYLSKKKKKRFCRVVCLGKQDRILKELNYIFTPEKIECRWTNNDPSFQLFYDSVHGKSPRLWPIKVLYNILQWKMTTGLKITRHASQQEKGQHVGYAIHAHILWEVKAKLHLSKIRFTSKAAYVSHLFCVWFLHSVIGKR